MVATTALAQARASLGMALAKVDYGRRLVFDAHDGVDLIGKGTHARFVIDCARFAEKVR